MGCSQFYIYICKFSSYCLLFCEKSVRWNWCEPLANCVLWRTGVLSTKKEMRRKKDPPLISCDSHTKSLKIWPTPENGICSENFYTPHLKKMEGTFWETTYLERGSECWKSVHQRVRMSKVFLGWSEHQKIRTSSWKDR
jgi:hypothetical protein